MIYLNCPDAPKEDGIRAKLGTLIRVFVQFLFAKHAIDIHRYIKNSGKDLMVKAWEKMCQYPSIC